MPFDAGSILGKLEWDMGDFRAAMAEAPSAASAAAGAVESAFHAVGHMVGEAMTVAGHVAREAFEGVTHAVAELSGPVVGHLVEQSSAAFPTIAGQATSILGEAFSNPIRASFHAIEKAAEDAARAIPALFLNVGEVVERVGSRFHDAGLAAERLGVEVEWLINLAAVGQTVGVGLDGLSTSLKLLEQRAEQAGEGQEGAVKGFNRLGISAQQAAALMDEPQKLFQLVSEKINAMENPSQRTAAALGVLGRQGANLVPLLAMTSGEFDRIAERMAALGGAVDKNEAEVGRSLGEMEAYFRSAFDAIERAVARPVLDYLADHLAAIEPRIETTTQAIVVGIEHAWDWLEGAVESATPKIEAAYELVSNGLAVAFGYATEAVDALWPAVQGAGNALSDLFGPSVGEVLPLLDSMAKLGVTTAGIVGGALTTAFEVLAPAVEAMGAALKDILEFMRAVNGVADEVYQSVASVLDAATGTHNFSVQGAAVGQATSGVFPDAETSAATATGPIRTPAPEWGDGESSSGDFNSSYRPSGGGSAYNVTVNVHGSDRFDSAELGRHVSTKVQQAVQKIRDENRLRVEADAARRNLNSISGDF